MPDAAEKALSDEALAVAARNAPACFESLYLRYADRVYRYALGRTGSPATADDVVGDTMVAALAGLARFDPNRGSFAGWLFTIAAQRIADEERRHRRFWQLAARWPTTEPTDEDVQETIARTEDSRELRRALQRLPAHDRDVLLLRFVAELPIRDVSTALAISESAAKMRVQRALARLARELERTDDAR